MYIKSSSCTWLEVRPEGRARSPLHHPVLVLVLVLDSSTLPQGSGMQATNPLIHYSIPNKVDVPLLSAGRWCLRRWLLFGYTLVPARLLHSINQTRARGAQVRVAGICVGHWLAAADACSRGHNVSLAGDFAKYSAPMPGPVMVAQRTHGMEHDATGAEMAESLAHTIYTNPPIQRSRRPAPESGTAVSLAGRYR